MDLGGLGDDSAQELDAAKDAVGPPKLPARRGERGDMALPHGYHLTGHPCTLEISGPTKWTQNKADRRAG